MNKIKRLCSFLLCAFLVMFLAPTIVFAESTEGYTGTYEVGTQSELVTAVNEINSADSGNFAINLKNDINITGRDIKFQKNTTTIFGEDHKLSGGNNVTIGVNNGAILNLGQSGYNKELTFTNGPSAGMLVDVSGNGSILNMYDNVVLKDHTYYFGGGVQVESGGTFNMHGGTINNCNATYYGGAILCYQGTFNMYGGTITNCEAIYGGAVCAGVHNESNNNINFYGGEITNCKAKSYGGAVYAQGSSITMTNGSITQNSAERGGGVAISTGASLILNGGTLCNNTATAAGSDIVAFNDTGVAPTLTLSSIANNTQNYQNSGKQIDGWYKDGPSSGERFNATKKLDPIDVSQTLTASPDSYYLVAAYKEDSSQTTTVKVKYEFGNGQSDVEETVKEGSSITLKEAPTKEGYEFKGWSDGTKTYQPKETVTVSEDTTFTAIWEKVVNNVRVKYEFGNGQSDVEETVKEGSSITLKEAPTKEGYEFKGWSDGTKTYQPKETVTVSEDTTFTAVWEKVVNNVKVKYDLGNGQGDVEETIKEGSSITLKEAPTKEGYTFKEWSDGTKTYQPKETVTVSKDMTFTAVWEKSR